MAKIGQFCYGTKGLWDTTMVHLTFNEVTERNKEVNVRTIQYIILQHNGQVVVYRIMIELRFYT